MEQQIAHTPANTQFDYAVFVAEVQEWASRNFPNSTPWQPLLGIGEEIGELASAADMANATEHDLFRDSAGDILVYMADYAWRNDLKLQPVTPEQRGKILADIGARYASREAIFQELIIASGKLFHSHLKMVQGIRGTPEEHQARKQERLQVLLCLLDLYCTRSGVDLEECIGLAWSEVKRRDWIKNKNDGRC